MNIESMIFDEALPDNSIAMFERGIEILRDAETNCIKSLNGEAKLKMRKLLWLINQQLFGQLAIIDMYNQWAELLAIEDDFKANSKSQEEIPFVAFGNDELDAAPTLGDTIICDMCGKEHKIEYGKKVNEDGTKSPSKLLAYFKCGDKSYLAGINGKDIRRK